MRMTTIYSTEVAGSFTTAVAVHRDRTGHMTRVGGGGGGRSHDLARVGMTGHMTWPG